MFSLATEEQRKKFAPELVIRLIARGYTEFKDLLGEKQQQKSLLSD